MKIEPDFVVDSASTRLKLPWKMTAVTWALPKVTLRELADEPHVFRPDGEGNLGPLIGGGDDGQGAKGGVHGNCVVHDACHCRE